MLASLAAFGVVGVGLVAFGARLGRRAFYVGIAPAVLSTVWVAARLGDVTGGAAVTERYRWVGGLDLGIDLRLDGLAATMSLVIAVVGVAVLVYAAHYFAPDAADLGRLA